MKDSLQVSHEAWPSSARALGEPGAMLFWLFAAMGMYVFRSSFHGCAEQREGVKVCRVSMFGSAVVIFGECLGSLHVMMFWYNGGELLSCWLLQHIWKLQG